MLVNGYEGDTYVCNFLMEMYGKCGDIEAAQFMFDDCLDEPNVFSWTIIISAYIHHRRLGEARNLFRKMVAEGVEPNAYTFSTILATCLNPSHAEEGEQIHASAILNGLDADAVVGTSLIIMYGKCKTKEDALFVFEKIQHKDIAAWNAIILVHAQHGDSKKTLMLFQQMRENDVEPNAITFSSVLGACNKPSFLVHGEVIHVEIVGSGFFSDIVIQNALIDMYGKCGNVANACAVFEKMQSRNIVSWTSIIGAHVQHPRQALQLYKQMLLSHVQPNEFTFLSVLAACGNLKAVEEGQLVHSSIIESGLCSNVAVATSLISMYGKCMNVESARWVFDYMNVRDLVLWNAIIAVYAQHGRGKDALDAFHQMREEGQRPDEITFTSLFNACSRSGLIKDACHIYQLMGKDYNILPSIEHYGCMVDLFGRASLMVEAEDCIHTMPFIPNVVIWETFVNACRIERDKKQP
jgi:pentatricopeptide repeat protein